MKVFILIFSAVFMSSFSHNAFSQCGGASPNLGADTVLCSGQSLVLSSSGSFGSYLWNNNTTLPTRTINQAGTYWLQVGTVGNNLIVNGDFESGNTGFTTNYALGTGGPYGLLSTEGSYAIVNSPSAAHNNFTSCADHTPNPGSQMMVVNGSATANTNIWCQTVATSPNTTYQLSTWASSALNDPNVAQLQFSINNTPVGTVFSPPSTGCTWTQFFQTWNSGIQTSAQICIKNQNIGGSGNDFMLDDITFTPLCFERDTIVVTSVPAPVIAVTPNDSICTGELSNIIASSSSPNLTYTWNPGAIVSPTLNVSPLSSAFYTVKAVDVNGCFSNLISRLVFVQTAPTVNLQYSDTVCAGNQASIIANTTGANLTYTWNPSLSTSNVLVDFPTNSTSYSLIVTNPVGCNAYDTASIYVIPTLTNSISGDLVVCVGDSTILTVSGNQAGMNYVWSNGETGNSIVVTSSEAGNYSVIGNFSGCPEATATVVVSVQDIPQLTLPGNYITCPGESIVATATSSSPGAVFNWINLGLTGSTQTISPTTSGYIYVTSQVGNCVSPIDSFLIEISPNCFFEIPNVFTPNGDNSNDFFQLVDYGGISSLTCVILNRWGNTVATFDKPDFKWDGTDGNGNKLGDGTYFYIIEAENYAKQAFKEHGIVQLIR
jgi:gliding motility-associated-like protein